MGARRLTRPGQPGGPPASVRRIESPRRSRAIAADRDRSRQVHEFALDPDLPRFVLALGLAPAAYAQTQVFDVAYASTRQYVPTIRSAYLLLAVTALQ